MENVKLTKTQKFEMIEKILNDTQSEEYDVPMLVEFVQEQIDALARKATKAKEKAAEKKVELDELAEVVLSVITVEPQTRDQIADQITGDDVTVAKVGARLSKLVALGKVEKSEVAATSASGKKTTRMAYALVPVEIDE